MTTLEEISKSRRKNRAFHNQCIRFTIAQIRYHADLAKKGSDLSAGLLMSYNATLCKQLEERKKFNYYNG